MLFLSRSLPFFLYLSQLYANIRVAQYRERNGKGIYPEWRMCTNWTTQPAPSKTRARETLAVDRSDPALGGHLGNVGALLTGTRLLLVERGAQRGRQAQARRLSH